MLRFRVTHSEAKRAVLMYHGDGGEQVRMEITDADGVGGLGEHFAADAFFQVHIHPEAGALHPHAGDDSKDLGTAEEETDTSDDKDAELAELHAHLMEMESALKVAQDDLAAVRAELEKVKSGQTPIPFHVEQTIGDAADPDKVAATTAQAIKDKLDAPTPPDEPVR